MARELSKAVSESSSQDYSSILMTVVALTILVRIAFFMMAGNNNNADAGSHERRTAVAEGGEVTYELVPCQQGCAAQRSR